MTALLISVLAVSLLTVVRAPPPPTTPPATYPNGTANPFFPCGYDAPSIAACPYRCYTPAGALQPSCYSAAAATAQIGAGNICVQCREPRAPRDYPGGCQPLATYFNVTSPTSRPSPCGVAGRKLANCTFVCAEAQVPFNVCSATDTSGTFAVCQKCVPQCSSPTVVFDPPARPKSFSLSAGSCEGDAAFGAPAETACPYRCTKAGTPNVFCSLLDKTDSNAFLNCTKC